MQNLVVINIHWVTHKSTQYFVDKGDVAAFVQAFRELHHTPGVNPYIKDRNNVCSKIYMITQAEVGPSGPYWWTTPGLGKIDAVKGAQIWEAQIQTEKTLFYDESMDPNYSEYSQTNERGEPNF